MPKFPTVLSEIACADTSPPTCSACPSVRLKLPRLSLTGPSTPIALAVLPRLTSPAAVTSSVPAPNVAEPLWVIPPRLSSRSSPATLPAPTLSEPACATPPNPPSSSVAALIPPVPTLSPPVVPKLIAAPATRGAISTAVALISPLTGLAGRLSASAAICTVPALAKIVSTAVPVTVRVPTVSVIVCPAVVALSGPASASEPEAVRAMAPPPLNPSSVPMLLAPVSVASPTAEPLSVPAVITPWPASLIVPAATRLTLLAAAASALPAAERSMFFAVTESGLPLVFTANPAAVKLPVVPRLMSTAPVVVSADGSVTSPPASSVTKLPDVPVSPPVAAERSMEVPACSVSALLMLTPNCTVLLFSVSAPLPALIRPSTVSGAVVASSSPPAPVLLKLDSTLTALAVPGSETPPTAVPLSAAMSSVAPLTSVKPPDSVVVRL